MDDRFKFRAWIHDDYVLKILGIFEPFMTYDIKFNGELIQFLKPNQVITASSEPLTIQTLALSSELMQSTGLKDKNGKLIYEGDIISIDIDNASRGCVNKYEVGYFMGGFIVVNIEDDSIDYPINFGWEYAEVLGNVYENKDLLEF